MKQFIFLVLALVGLNQIALGSCDVSTSLCDSAVTTSKILDGTIANADVSSSAAISYSKLSLTSSILQGDLSVQVLRYVDVAIAAGAMDTLNATPVNLVAAGGSGTIIDVEKVVCFNDFAAAAFELGSGTLDVRYENSSGGLAAQFTNAWTESTADAYFSAVGRDVVMLVNKAIVIHASADVTAGDGALNCRTYYRTITVSDI